MTGIKKNKKKNIKQDFNPAQQQGAANSEGELTLNPESAGSSPMIHFEDQ